MNARSEPQPHLTSSVTLDRDDIVTGLTALVCRLHDGGTHAVIQIVGGAAIALTVNSARRATRDVDAPIAPAAEVREAARSVAQERGWPADWLNDRAAQFVPSGFGRSPEWMIVHRDHLVTIAVASAPMLLAMKLHATQTRRLRELDDLTALLPTCGITTVDEAEALYGDFYPGDAFSASTASIVAAVLAADVAAPSRPEPPRFG